ncbi:MAG: low temperature requirement protein A [Nocardioidaceae bacterium]
MTSRRMSSGLARVAAASIGVRSTTASHRVTTLELLFDLVFVFAFTQVTQLMADDPTATGALRGLVLLALLWWAWCSYAWLGNQAHADEGLVRLTIIVAMVAMFVVALAIPESFADIPGACSRRSCLPPVTPSCASPTFPATSSQPRMTPGCNISCC